MAHEQGKTPTEVPVKRQAEAPAPAPGLFWPTWEQEIDRLFDDFFRPTSWPTVWGAERSPLAEIESRLPAVDLYESGDEIVVKADLPGVSKEQIEVNLTDAMLTLKGEKKRDEEAKEEAYYLRERAVGTVSRTIRLPSPVKTEGAKAIFTDGVLEIRLPKTENAKRKATKVQVQ